MPHKPGSPFAGHDEPADSTDFPTLEEWLELAVEANDGDPLTPAEIRDATAAYEAAKEARSEPFQRPETEVTGFTDEELLGQNLDADPFGGIEGATFSSDSLENYQAFLRRIDPALDQLGISVSAIRPRINAAATEFARDFGRWPTARELDNYDVWNTAFGNYIAGFNELPPFFSLDGVLLKNDPMQGPSVMNFVGNAAALGELIPREADVQDAEPPQIPGGNIGFERRPTTTPQPAAPGGVPIPTQFTAPGFGMPEPTAQVPLPAFPGGVPIPVDFGLTGAGTGIPTHTQFPNYARDELTQILQNVQVARRPPARRSGGTGRQPIQFDDAALTRRAEDLYRDALVEAPRGIGRIIDSYKDEARSFWRSGGGTLDFDTFVIDELEQTSRWQGLYRNKPEFQSYQEYIGQFRQTAGRLGLSGGTTQRAIETGAAVGSSISGFQERLTGLREFQQRNQGTFSQRFAAQVASLGNLGRS